MNKKLQSFIKKVKKDTLIDINSIKNNPAIVLLTTFSIAFSIILLYNNYRYFILFVLFVFGITFIILFIYNSDFYSSYFRKITNTSLIDLNFDFNVCLKYEVWKILQSQKIYKKILLNCYIPKSNKKVTKIDIIMINNFGIYVFECVSRAGFIVASDNDSKWYQILGKNDKYLFNSPVIKNKNNISDLNNIVKLNSNIYKSFVIFDNNCSLNKSQFSNKNLFVCYKKNLHNIFKSFDFSKIILSNDEIDNLYDSLRIYMHTNKKIKGKKRNVKKKKYYNFNK